MTVSLKKQQKTVQRQKSLLVFCSFTISMFRTMSAYVGIHPGPERMVTITDHQIFEENGHKHDIMLLKIDPPENKIKPVVLPKCTRRKK